MSGWVRQFTEFLIGPDGESIRRTDIRVEGFGAQGRRILDKFIIEVVPPNGYKRMREERTVEMYNCHGILYATVLDVEVFPQGEV